MEPSTRPVCLLRHLPGERWLESARNARAVDPDNVPEGVVLEELANEGERLAVDVRRFWGPKGVKLTVGFLDGPPPELRARVLAHFNAWSNVANVRFVESDVDPQVRISRAEVGYWSYLGTDLLLVERTLPTMSLQGFTMETPESEFRRVVRHEAGHALGFPHEHLREQVIARLDAERVIAYFMGANAWSRQQVIDQMLAPIEERSLLGTPDPDETSIMCYEVPAQLTKDGRPIVGGFDINKADALFAGRVYPPLA